MSGESSKKRSGVFTWRPFFVVISVHILAVIALFYYSIPNLIGFLIAHFLVGCIGGVIGLHRYFSHKSFRCPTWFENLLGFLATLNLQQGPITWSMYHRAHHRFSENQGDPHSAMKGFFWSHIGWLFFLAPNGFRKRTVSVLDLRPSKVLAWLDNNHLLVNIISGGLFLLAAQDLGLFLWVFPLRIVVVWHTTWLINSYVHSAPLIAGPNTKTKIFNSPLVSLLLYGEGWHLNHHRHPGLPRAGLTLSQFDPAFWILLVCRQLGLIEFNKSYSNTKNYIFDESI